jgi:hypothetical protein
VLEIMLYGGGYLAVAGALMGSFGREAFNESPGPFFLGLLWPVAMPIVGGFKLIDKVKNRTPRKPKAVTYAEAPLSILAAMVAQRILAHPEAIGRDKWKKDGIVVDAYTSPCRLCYVQINDKTFNSSVFTEKDKKTIEKAFEQAAKLKEEKAAADALAAVNHKALDVIESLMVTPVKLPSPEGSKASSQLTPL